MSRWPLRAALLAICGCVEAPHEVELSTTLQVEILSPADGRTYRGSSNVEIRWQGRPAFVDVFRYRLLGLSDDWSTWTADTTLVLELADGSYTFEVVARAPGYMAGPDTSEHAVAEFTVDVLAGPALFLRPRETTVLVGDPLRLAVTAKEVSGLMSAHIVVRADEGLRLDTAFVDTPFFGANISGVYGVEALAGGAQLPTGPFVVASVDRATGVIDLILLNSALGVSGTGPLVTVQFTAVETGPAIVRLAEESGLTDVLGVPIPVTLEQLSFIAVDASDADQSDP